MQGILVMLLIKKRYGNKLSQNCCLKTTSRLCREYYVNIVVILDAGNITK